MDPSDGIASTKIDPAADPGASFEQRRVAAQLRREMFGARVETKIGRFVVGEQLGAGAMGVVYAAHDPELDRPVAIKLMSAERSGAASQEGRLRKEAQAMAKLNHPNVATVHEVGLHDGRIFVAMELIEGQSLRSWVQEVRRSWTEILDAYLQAGEGLVAAHEAGLVHRDFKPDNVMVGKDGRVRVLDFGLAWSGGPRPVADTAPGDVPVDRLTATGSILGTPAYMPPEQLAGQPTDARSDQFAYCVSLFEALYGRRPFAGDTLDTLRTAIREGAVEPPATRRGPAWLRRALRRGLSSDPADRWPTMADLLVAIRRGRVRRTRGALVAGGVAVVGVAGFAIWSARPDPVCGPATDEVAGLWNDDMADGIRARFTGTDIPFAEDTFGGIEREVDRLVDDWAATWDEACSHADDPRLRQRELDCLQQSRQQIELYVGSLSLGGVEDAVLRPHRVFALLADPRECTDPRIVRAAPEPPGADEAETVEEIRAELLLSYAKRASTVEELDRIFEPLLRRAEGLAYPMAAEVMITWAERLSLLASRETSEVLAQAVEISERTRHDPAAARARLLRAHFNMNTGEPAGVGSDLEAAEAAVARAGNPIGLDVSLRRARAKVAVLTGKADEAVSMLAAASQRLEARYGPLSVRHGQLWLDELNASSATCDVETGLAVADRIEATVRAFGGDRHTFLEGVDLLRARMLFLCGDRDGAMKALARADAAHPRGAGPDGTYNQHVLRSASVARAELYVATHRCHELEPVLAATIPQLEPEHRGNLHALGVVAGLACGRRWSAHTLEGAKVVAGGAHVTAAWELHVIASGALQAEVEGRAEEAAAGWKRVREFSERVPGIRRAATVWEALRLAAAGQQQEALNVMRGVLAEGEWTWDIGRANYRLTVVWAAELMARAGEPREALEMLGPVMETLEQCCDDTPLFAWALLGRGRARRELGEREPALADARQAVGILDAAGDAVDPALVAAVRQFLVEHG